MTKAAIDFFEIVMDSRSFSEAGFEGRDEIEDPVQEVLEETGLGEVTGGGAGSGKVIVDVEVFSAEDFARAVEVVSARLREIQAPKGTRIKYGKPRAEIVVIPET